MKLIKTFLSLFTEKAGFRMSFFERINYTYHGMKFLNSFEKHEKEWDFIWGLTTLDIPPNREAGHHWDSRWQFCQ